MNRFSLIQIRRASQFLSARESIFLLLICCCHNCCGQEIPELNAETSLPRTATSAADTNLVDEKLIQEISGIRSRLGGGVASQLKGLLPDSATSNGNGNKSPGVFSAEQMQSEFEAELRKLANRQDSLPSPGVAVVASPSPHMHGSLGQDNVKAVGLSPAVASSLRRTARNLELSAAALEEAARFSQADKLRESARQLWIEARLQNVPQSPACATVSNPEATGINR